MTHPQGTKVLINGAGGFIGSHLVRDFLAAGYAVRASDMPGVDLSWAAKAGAETVASSLEDFSSVDRAVEGVDIVVHTAAIFDLACPREKILTVNIQGTRYHCEAAVKHKVRRFVLFSTSGIYGAPKQIPCREDAPKNPRNAYEESKWLSEELAMDFYHEHGLPVTALRPTLVYGPGSKYGQAMYLTLFLCLKFWGMKAFPIGKGGRLTHHVHVDDVVSAVRVLAESPDAVGRGFNVADSIPVSAEDTMRLLCESTGLAVRDLPSFINTLAEPMYRMAPYLFTRQIEALNRRLARSWPRLVQEHGLEPALQSRFDMGWLAYLSSDHHYSTDALRALGWEPSKQFLDGMRETVAWYQDQKWIPTAAAMNAARKPAASIQKV